MYGRIKPRRAARPVRVSYLGKGASSMIIHLLKLSLIQRQESLPRPPRLSESDCGQVWNSVQDYPELTKSRWGGTQFFGEPWTLGPDRSSALYMRKVQSKPTQAQVWNHATSRTRAGFEPVNAYENPVPFEVVPLQPSAE